MCTDPARRPHDLRAPRRHYSTVVSAAPGRVPTRSSATRRVLLAVTALAAPATAQAPLTGINADTEVRSIGFEFVESSSFRGGTLRRVIALTDPSSAAAVERILASLHLGRELPPHPFDPVELQRDVVRLRRFYERSGFIRPAVDYRVDFDEPQNLVDVTFVIHEGRPVTVSSLRAVWHDGAVPDDLRRSWEGMVAGLPIAPGARLDREAVTRTENTVAGWLADRGYPFAAAHTEATVDSAVGSSTVLLHATPGPRSRIGAIVVQGNVDVSTEVILRALPFHPGDWFDARQLSAGAQRLRSLGIFKLARADLVPDQEPDTTVAVRVYVQEDRPRRTTAEVGYISDGGIAVQGEWSHRNFMGGARTLSVNGVGQTGWLAISSNPDQGARGVVTLRQPQFLRAGVDGLVSPFAEYRNDYRDESWQIGLSTGLVYQLGPIQSVALQYQVARRQILEYRFGDFSSGEIDILTLLALASAGVLDSLGETFVESRLTLTATLGSLDDHSNPRRGFLIRPSLGFTTPSTLNTVEYARFDIGANVFYPIGRRSSIAIRVALGRLFPFGKSLPEPGEAPALQYLQLRDVAFTAGGTSDVRGWANRELGPKFPDLRVRTEDSTIVASRYVPIGGLARALTSIEARLPMPLLGDRWGSHVFLDGGRVWTSDDRFRMDADTLAISGYYWATGLGIDLLTPVGPLRVSLGYKLNPSPLDLRDPGEVIRALVNDEPLESVPEDNWRRFQFHFTVGITY